MGARRRHVWRRAGLVLRVLLVWATSTVGAGADCPRRCPDVPPAAPAASPAPAAEPRVPIRYFAEGAVGAFFQTTLVLFNPGPATVSATLRFLGASGGQTSDALTIPGGHPLHVDALAFGVPSREFSAVVEATGPLVVERRMTWGEPSTYGSHSGTGVAAPSSVWHFAEGATIAGLQTFFLLQNPADVPTIATMRYLLATGDTHERRHVVGAHSRLTVWANMEGGPMGAAEFGTTILADLPIVSERAMYRDAAGQPFGAGSVVSGVATPDTSWLFAEGATGAFFDTYLLMANPGESTATIRVEYLRAVVPGQAATAQAIVRTYRVPGRSRRTIWVREEDPALADTQVGLRLTSDTPIVAERTMWWPGPSSATWAESHAETGAPAGGLRWGLADIQSDPESGGWDTFLLVATPAQEAALVRVRVSCADGLTTTRDVPHAGNRTTLWMRHVFPEIVGRRCGATVESLPTDAPGELRPAARVVVEKAMYFGVGFAAGGVALATRLPDPPG